MPKIAFCFDLDGTVTKQEILPLIAKEVGLNEEINLLTDITLKGIIPFETSFKLRVRLLSTIAISVVRNVIDKVILDDNISNFIQENKSNCYIISGNLDVWVGEFIKTYLGCEYYTSKAKYEGDTLLGIERILNKGKSIDELREKYQKIVAVGDSMNDCSMFEKSEVKIAYGGIHNPVDTLIKLSDYVIYDSKSLTRLLNSIKNEN